MAMHCSCQLIHKRKWHEWTLCVFSKTKIIMFTALLIYRFALNMIQNMILKVCIRVILVYADTEPWVEEYIAAITRETILNQTLPGHNQMILIIWRRHNFITYPSLSPRPIYNIEHQKHCHNFGKPVWPRHNISHLVVHCSR